MIDTCDNDFLLREAKAILELKSTDWWDDLSEQDKSLVMESETAYKSGDFISHSQLMEQFTKWKEK